MHKKLAADLTSLAHSILQMKNKHDVFALQKKAHQLYERLSVLAYVEEYINSTPNPNHTKEELIQQVENVMVEEDNSREEMIKHDLEDIIETAVEVVTENEVEMVEEKIEQKEELIDDIAEKTESTEVKIEKEILEKNLFTAEIKNAGIILPDN